MNGSRIDQDLAGEIVEKKVEEQYFLPCDVTQGI